MKSLLLALALAVVALPVLAQTQDLILSEYIEGSTYNKALEIYNGTDYPVALGSYELELYANGSTVPATIDLGDAVLASGEVFVVANPSADAVILAQADLTSGALTFSGNDALVLRGDGLVVDSLGQVGNDPGTGWACANGSTYNTTLRRQIDICAGDEDPFDDFSPCPEYDFFPNDNSEGLGSHTADCQSVSNGPASWGGLKALYR